MSNILKTEIDNFCTICDFIGEEPIGKAIMSETGNSVRKIFIIDCARIAMLPSYYDSQYAKSVSNFLLSVLSVNISVDTLKSQKLDNTAIRSNIVNRIPEIVKIFVEMDKHKGPNDNTYFSLVSFQVFAKLCQGILNSFPGLQIETKNYILDYIKNIRNYISNTLHIDVELEVR